MRAHPDHRLRHDESHAAVGPTCPVLWWCVGIAVLAGIAGAVGLLQRDGPGPFPVETVRGQVAELSGRRLYRYDTVFTTAGSQATDRVTLLLGVPLLVGAAVGWWRGSTRAGLVLLGALGYFLYVYAGCALMAAALTGVAPEGLGPYSTEFTEALDLAVITPATAWAGVLILRRDPRGYLIVVSLLVLEILLAPLIIAQTVLQLRAGVTFTGPEILGPVLGFVVLAVASAAVLGVILRSVPAAAPRAVRAPRARTGGAP